MKRTRNRKSALALFVGIAAVLLFLFTTPLISAFATEENTVNPQQLPDSSFLYDTSIAELANADAYHQNQTVQIVGEVVGDSIRGDAFEDHCWITLASNDSASNDSVAVYMTEENAEKIDAFGKYGKTGTILQVRGVFHLTCPTHEGVTDLHAEYVSIAEKGKQQEDVFDGYALAQSGVVVAVGLIFMFVYYRMRERLR